MALFGIGKKKPAATPSPPAPKKEPTRKRKPKAKAAAKPKAADAAPTQVEVNINERMDDVQFAEVRQTFGTILKQGEQTMANISTAVDGLKSVKLSVDTLTQKITALIASYAADDHQVVFQIPPEVQSGIDQTVALVTQIATSLTALVATIPPPLTPVPPVDPNPGDVIEDPVHVDPLAAPRHVHSPTASTSRPAPSGVAGGPRGGMPQGLPMRGTGTMVLPGQNDPVRNPHAESGMPIGRKS